MVKKDPEIINGCLEDAVPELRGTECGRYPLQRENWIQPHELLPNGEKAFLAHPNNNPKIPPSMIPEYVYGPGTYGFGYYHLWTKEAYQILATRLRAEKGKAGLFRSKDFKEHQKKVKVAEYFMHVRSISKWPDDINGVDGQRDKSAGSDLPWYLAVAGAG